MNKARCHTMNSHRWQRGLVTNSHCQTHSLATSALANSNLELAVVANQIRPRGTQHNRQNIGCYKYNTPTDQFAQFSIIFTLQLLSQLFITSFCKTFCYTLTTLTRYPTRNPTRRERRIGTPQKSETIYGFEIILDARTIHTKGTNRPRYSTAWETFINCKFYFFIFFWWIPVGFNCVNKRIKHYYYYLVFTIYLLLIESFLND